MNMRVVLWIGAVLSLLLVGVSAQEPTTPPAEAERIDPAEAESADEFIEGLPAEEDELTVLRPFGYDIFNLLPSEIDTLIGSVDPEYPIGPGDEIVITFWGDMEKSHTLQVDRQGGITIPRVGQIQVSGLLLGELDRKIIRFLARAYSTIREDQTQATTFVDVSLGKLRTIQVFVVGEVRRPGAYLINATSTVLNALYQAGGPIVGGSLRNIRLVRHDRVISSLDFYKFILEGNKSEDVRLQNGDVILIPPVDKEVGLHGQVHRPAIYELKQGEGLKDLLAIAGDLQPEAYTERIQIKRSLEHRKRQMIDVNLVSILLSEDDYPLADGDQISISTISEKYENAVSIQGAIMRPGEYQLLPESTVKDLIQKSAGIHPEAFLGRADLVRTHPDLIKELIPFHLGKALKEDPEHNLVLEPSDQITIYSIHTFGDYQSVSIDGLVRKPGSYELVENMHLQDLIVLAGGLLDAAHKLEAEIARSDPDAATAERPIQLFRIPISAIYEIGSGPSDGFSLQNVDAVFIRSNPDFEPQQYVEIRGQIRFPGTYALRSRSERLTEIIERAGNLKKDAYLEGIKFARPSTGSIAVDLKAALKKPDGLDNLILQGGDVIEMPQRPSTVEIVGAVFDPKSVLFRRGESVDYYLERTGGLTKRADKGRIYVVLANGETLKPGRFLFWRTWPKINPGSRIVVPAEPAKD